MLKQHGFVIYAGQAAFAKVLFRVSPMGAIGTSDVRRQIAAISDIVRALNPAPKRLQGY